MMHTDCEKQKTRQMVSHDDRFKAKWWNQVLFLVGVLIIYGLGID